MSYTNEQYRKDRKKLIGVGLLICALIIFLLHNWNMGQLAEMRAERERIEMEQRVQREKGIEERPTIPGFGDVFDFDRFITPEMMDEIIKEMGKAEIQYREEKFANFKMTVSSKWQEVKKEELERVFPEIIYEIDKVNAEILFLAHNFDIEKIVINMLERGDIRMLDMSEIDFQKIGLQEILIFNIMKFEDLKKVDDFVNVIKEFDEKSEYFEIINKNVIQENENEIRIAAQYYLSQRVDDRVEKIKIYSHKKIIFMDKNLINKNLYAFIFLSDSEIIGDKRKEVDKILESVIMN